MISIQQRGSRNDSTESVFAVYLEEIRRRVCSLCPYRPPGGPPCAPCGTLCEVELHLPLLIDSVGETREDDPGSQWQCYYQRVCEGCVLDGRPTCPCAIERFSAPLLAAVRAADESVRESGEEQSPVRRIRRPKRSDARAVYRVYRLAAGTWTGCDWPTHFGPSRLDLNDWPSLGAAAMARKTRSATQRLEWRAAARWLARIEERAKSAELLAGLAVAAANVGQWREARQLAAQAWAFESATGRPFFRGLPPAWQRLTETIEAAALVHESSREMIDRNASLRIDHPTRWPVLVVPSPRSPQGL